MLKLVTQTSNPSTHIISLNCPCYRIKLPPPCCRPGRAGGGAGNLRIWVDRRILLSLLTHAGRSLQDSELFSIFLIQPVTSEVKAIIHAPISCCFYKAFKKRIFGPLTFLEGGGAEKWVKEKKGNRARTRQEESKKALRMVGYYLILT